MSAEPILKRLKEPKPSHLSFRSLLPSRKLGRDIEGFCTHKLPKNDEYLKPTTVTGESLLEMRLHILLEHEKKVFFYDYQAVPKNKDDEFNKIIYLTMQNNLVGWTPDASIIWDDQKPLVIEVKTLDNLGRNYEELENKLNQSERYAEKQNWGFYVFTDAHIKDSFRVENLVDLESFLDYAEKECMDVIKNCFEKVDRIWTVKQLQDELITTCNFTQSQILASTCKLIYDNELYIDLDKRFSYDKTPITKEIHRYIPLDRWFKRYNWKNDLEDAKNQGLVGIVNKDELSKKQKEKIDRDKEIVRLKEKEGWSSEIIADKYSIHWRTVYKVVERGNQEKIQETRGRKPKILFTVGQEAPHFHDKQFEETIEEFKDQTKWKKSELYRSYMFKKRLYALKKGLTEDIDTTDEELRNVLGKHEAPVSKKKFDREIIRYERFYKKLTIIAREGARTAGKILRNVTSSTPFKNYAGQFVQIDHTATDVLPVISPLIANALDMTKKSGKASSHYMDRPILTVVIDLYTRVILGYCIRYHKPSRESAFIAFRRTVLGNVPPLIDEKSRKYFTTINKIIKGLSSMLISGIIIQEEYNMCIQQVEKLRALAAWWDSLKTMPRIIGADNGSDLVSDDVKNWASKYKIKLTIRPVGQAQFGGHVERVLQTLNFQAFHSVSGTTKGSLAQKGVYKSHECAILTFEEIEALFLLVILIYHVRVHSSLGVAPYVKWERAKQRGDCLSQKWGETESKQFAYDTLPKERRKYDSAGIPLYGIRYNYDPIPDSIDKSWAELTFEEDWIYVGYNKSDIRFV